jgi:hypothetical protein
MAEIKSKTKEIKDDLKANTDETVNTRKGVEEHDSVTRNIAKVATSAVCQNVAANEKVLQETQEIKKALNGGPDGVGSRFTKIEERQKFQDEALVTLANAVGQLTLDLADHRREYQKNNPNHSS